MSEQPQPRSIKKLLIFGTLALCIPILLVSMAFLAVNSDAENQEKYKQQQAEMIARIKAREEAEKKQASEQQVNTEVDGQAASEASTAQ
ncbi:hypothetical protein BS636_00150 [Acinetobacter sp. LoGeW2-3]|uniref:hypothetical protein n=1 Tax=Acinetobacter sp. LoGeW2-3 TaxID=1808001 RepID=UPI000C05C374|nr:hypothetical protein [Acinetobacter sp. LoGeW2-3]ATO18200.1 hypothetical protein BS636_00150 [Acinetobacter sp. LoGeW2-3]